MHILAQLRDDLGVGVAHKGEALADLQVSGKQCRECRWEVRVQAVAPFAVPQLGRPGGAPRGAILLLGNRLEHTGARQGTAAGRQRALKTAAPHQEVLERAEVGDDAVVHHHELVVSPRHCDATHSQQRGGRLV